MKTLTWQKPGQQNVAQELIKIIINYVAELRYYINFPKEALVSINLGFDANKDRLETIRQHLINNDYNIGNISIKQIEEKLLK